MEPTQPLIPHLILSVGTQVVALVEVRGSDGAVLHPRGSAGAVIRAPADYWHSYRVRFPDGLEASLHRQQLAILSSYKTGIIGQGADPMAEYDLYAHVIYRCIVGSRAYGLDNCQSDTDRRGIYLPPAHLHWSLYGAPEQLENPQTARLPYVSELIAKKLAGPEQSTLKEDDFSFHQGEYERLRGVLEAAFQATALPEGAIARPALHRLLLRLRGLNDDLRDARRNNPITPARSPPPVFGEMGGGENRDAGSDVVPDRLTIRDLESRRG